MIILTEINCRQHEEWLAIFTCVLSLIAIVTSVPMNGTVLVTVAKNKKFHTNFHSIIFSITLADFLIGVIICPLSVDLHINEAKNNPTSDLKTQVFRFGLIALGTASILSVTVLSIDRIISLKFTQRYREMKKRYFLISLIAVWVFTLLLSPAYLFLSFTLYLVIFSISIVLITAIIMIITYMFYKVNLRRSFNRTYSTDENIQNNESCYSKQDSITSANTNANNSKNISLVRKISGLTMLKNKKMSRVSLTCVNQAKLEEHQIYQIEKRATNTFFYMTLAFLMCYMPVVGLSIYLHLCKQCSCLATQVITEIIIIFIMASAVFKTFIFLVRLTALRKACVNLFISEKELERRWKSESAPRWRSVTVPQIGRKQGSRKKLLRRAKTHDEDDEGENGETVV